MTTRPDIYGGKRPRELALYSMADTARTVRLSPATLRSWVLGRRYPTREGDRQSWSELAEDFGLSESAIAEAVRFETELRRAA